MKELKIGERVEVVMEDGSNNVGVVIEDLEDYGYSLKLELPTEDGEFYGYLTQIREPYFFWECKLKDGN